MNMIYVTFSMPDSIFDEDIKGEFPQFSLFLEKLNKVAEEMGGVITSSDF